MSCRKAMTSSSNLSTEVQLTEASTVVTSQDDSGSGGESESILVSGDNQTEDSNATTLSDVQPVMDAVAGTGAALEETRSTDDGDIENSFSCKTNGGEKRSSHDKGDSDGLEQCSQMVSTKARGGRSYQENRRSKKTVGEKSKLVSGTSKCDMTREVGDPHGVDASCLEQKGKGDVRDAKMPREDSQRHMKESVCHPTCDGDPPALVNVIVDEHDMRRRYHIQCM